MTGAPASSASERTAGLEGNRAASVAGSTGCAGIIAGCAVDSAGTAGGAGRLGAACALTAAATFAGTAAGLSRINTTIRTPRLMTSNAATATAHHGRSGRDRRIGASASDGPTVRCRSFSDFFSASRMKLTSSPRSIRHLAPAAEVRPPDCSACPARSESAHRRCHRH